VFYYTSQRCTNTGRQFREAIDNFYVYSGPPTWTILHVTPLTLRTLRLLADFWKIFGAVTYGSGASMESFYTFTKADDLIENILGKTLGAWRQESESESE